MNAEERKQYEEYFQNTLSRLESEYKRTEKYARQIDDQIDKFEKSPPGKGSQHYLIEHIKNAITLQSQKQSLIKDEFGFKKAILDYSLKNTEASNEKDLFVEIERLINQTKVKYAHEDVLLEDSGDVDGVLEEFTKELEEGDDA